MGRPLRILQTEYPYHLTCRTNNRTFRFHQRQFTKLFFRAVVQSTKKYNFLVHHIVLMNNHCVFRGKLSTDSDANCPPIPIQTVH
ncbi:MAG TPA: hypothetical protein ENH32_03265 [Proteobacteria bacterium]|nr:hypothetical protein [Pseudomonadota bacterium]